MQGSRRVTQIVVVLAGLTIIAVGMAVALAPKIGTEGVLPIAAGVISLLILSALLIFFLGRWLLSNMKSNQELAAFLLVMLIGALLVAVSIAAVGASGQLQCLLPLMTAAICLTLIDLARKRLSIESYTVKGGTVAVVQRNGFFDRLEEPGTILLTGNNEEVAYAIPTTDQTRFIDIGILHMGALAYGYRLRVHFRLDPEQLIDPDDNKLQHLNSSTHVLETIQEAIHSAMQQVEQVYDAGAPETFRTDWIGSLLRIWPDTPMRKNFLNSVNQTTAETLKPEGIEWNTERGLIVAALRLPYDLKTALTRAEYDRLLAEHNTSMDSASQSRLYTWISQSEPLDIPFEFKTPRNQRDNDVDPVPKPRKPRPKPVNIPLPSLSDEDLSIMKRIPG